MNNLSTIEPHRPQSPDALRNVFTELRDVAAQHSSRKIEDSLLVLDRLGKLWQPDGNYFRQAKTLLAGLFSSVAIEAALQNLVMSLNQTVIAAEVQRELGRLDLLDRWQPDEMNAGCVRGYPLGVVGQILAGNVFLNGVIGMAQCLLTGNAAVLKLSRQESGFTTLFYRSLCEADADKVVTPSIRLCRWSGQDDTFNQIVREEADAVVVWGGESAVAAYPAEGCRGKVIHYGPRLGIGFVLDGVDLEPSLAALAWDVALWEQRACSSPRLVFVESMNKDFPRLVAEGLHRALATTATAVEPSPLDLDGKAEVLSLRELAWWTEQAEIFATPNAMDHTVVLLRQLPQEIPVGYRTVFIVPMDDMATVSELLQPFRTVLQTAVLAAPADRWPATVDQLIACGITQVAAAGSAASRFLGLPHEGDFALRRLIRLAGIDLGIGALTYPNRAPHLSRTISAALAGSSLDRASHAS